ncbi:DUF2125 domain-containing protein [Mesorhizobium sp. CAU 1741]|uniref:DUF2125 domain-containing protein n=1 Tax=Mesorhizobium sp. CAU 1741 TaxID=3140366 RepID=UPI00325B8603
MTSSQPTRTNYSRRFFWFAVAIVLAIGAYTAGWYYAAGELTQRVNAGVAALNGDGRRASCENAEARGYPFRIGVFCRSVMFEESGRGIGFRAREFRSAAQVYAPRHALAELEGPATLQFPGLMAMDLEWSSLRASSRLASPVPDLISLEARDLAVGPDEPGALRTVLWRADQMEVHMRPAGEDLDLAIRFSGLSLDGAIADAVTLPAFEGLVDLQLARAVTIIDPLAASLRGRSGILRDATITVAGSEAGVTIRGPVSVDDQGLVDAELDVTLREARAIAEILVSLLPDARQEIELSLSAIEAMGETPTLPLRIVNGDVSVGFISLGAIPPL